MRRCSSRSSVPPTRAGPLRVHALRALVRLIEGAQRKDFDPWLTKNFGALNQSNAERQAEIVRYRKFRSVDFEDQ